MKKISVTIISILIIFMISCTDELNQVPISNVSANIFYKTATDFKQAVNGVYNALGANPSTGNGYAIRRFMLSEIRSDNIYCPGTAGTRDRVFVNNFQSNLANNALITEAWASNYVGILRANTILDQLDSIKVSDKPTRDQIEGEAKFLRAFFYFDLVRYFGKVPIIDHAVTTTEALSIPRGEVADVYNLIISDLSTASTKLPLTFTGVDKGRATSLAAKAMLGLVYLTRTGPTYGINGPGLATTEFDKAVSLFNDVIGSGKFSVVPTYAAIFSWANEGNPDIVFDIQAIGGNTGDLGLGARFPTDFVDANYATSQGIKFAGGAETDAPQSPSADLRNSFEVGDARKTFSIINSYPPSGTPQFVKFWDKTQAGVDRFNWPLNFPALRYTDVLMMKAEAILRGGFGANCTQADVDAIVNQVRTRAGLTPRTNVTLDQLLTERRHEFMEEGLRWHDLVRNGTVITTMNAWRTIDDTAGKISPIVENYIIYPLPVAQITGIQAGYEQNPGY